MFELKTSYVFFGTDTDALQIVYCEQYPQAKGMTLEEFMREYFSSPVTGEMEADFDNEALVEFLRRKNSGRTVSFSSRDGKYSYRFTAYSRRTSRIPSIARSIRSKARISTAITRGII